MSELFENTGDELKMSLGHVVLNFSALENLIQMFIGRLMVKARGSNDSAEMNFQLQLAMTITSELPFYKLLTMLSSLHKHMEKRAEAVAQLEEILKKAGGGANQRDTLIHSSYFTPTFVPSVIRAKTSAKKVRNQPVNLKTDIQYADIDQVNSVADLLWESCISISKFMHENGYTPGRN
jgi:hypothetical protein